MWDAYKCHLTDPVKAKVKQTKPDVVVVPGGLTKHIQPTDVSLNKPFKEVYRNKYEEWLSSGKMSFTPVGNESSKQTSLSTMGKGSLGKPE